MPRKYIHELKDWPQFSWNSEKIAEPLARVRHKQGRLIGRMESLGFALQEEAVLSVLTQDAIKTSEIEGQFLNPEQVRSSLARRLGINIGGLTPANQEVEGLVTMLLDATQNFKQPLSSARLLSWHASLFPRGFSGMMKVRTGNWRDDSAGPMQVVSGIPGREIVHFVAPDAGRLTQEMQYFLDWFEGDLKIDPVLKAALAHLWFVTIHPFDDGNGRIARAIADMSLARSEMIPQRFYSMSAQIRLERKAYYEILERTQKATMDITPWMNWFLACLDRALDGAQVTSAAILAKAKFWDSVAGTTLNDRQRTILNLLLDGFEGKLTSSKWAKLNKCSQDTAHRDIIDLIEKGILMKEASGGRSSSYSLRDPSH